ncbi:hypothetical protein E2542_SST12612 [Spatholobus suberectus]|nr:hypothetical protein E2542_SST12612 [Spatholobus suberectus]
MSCNEHDRAPLSTPIQGFGVFTLGSSCAVKHEHASGKLCSTEHARASVFPRPMSSAMRHRAPLLNANLNPSCWKGSNASKRVLGSFAIRCSTSSSAKCFGGTNVHRPVEYECERRSTTLNVAQGISSTCSASAVAFSCLSTMQYSSSLNTQAFTHSLVYVKCHDTT